MRNYFSTFSDSTPVKLLLRLTIFDKAKWTSGNSAAKVSNPVRIAAISCRKIDFSRVLVNKTLAGNKKFYVKYKS
jgi:hypothetical protein